MSSFKTGFLFVMVMAAGVVADARGDALERLQATSNLWLSSFDEFSTSAQSALCEAVLAKSETTNELISAWFSDFTTWSVTTNSAGTCSWIQAQALFGELISSYDGVVSGRSNAWFAVAERIGGLRSAFTRQEMSVYENFVPTFFNGFGEEIERARRIYEEERIVHDRVAPYAEAAERWAGVLTDVMAPKMRMLDAPVREFCLSNIVERAHLTTNEMTRLRMNAMPGN